MELTCKHINVKPHALTKLDDDSCFLSWIEKPTKMMEANLLVEAVEFRLLVVLLIADGEGWGGGGVTQQELRSLFTLLQSLVIQLALLSNE